MAKKLIDWNSTYASSKEKKLAKVQNINSNISILIKSVGT